MTDLDVAAIRERWRVPNTDPWLALEHASEDIPALLDALEAERTWREQAEKALAETQAAIDQAEVELKLRTACYCETHGQDLFNPNECPQCRLEAERQGLIVREET